MVRVSNASITFLNIVTLLLSLVAIGASIWVGVHQGSVCHNVLQRPLLISGLFLLVVSLFGLIGSCCKVSFFLWIYLAVMFLLILGLVCFTVFAIIVTNKGVGKAISSRGYKEYRLDDYSHWLQKYVVNDKNWNTIKICMIDAQVCQRLGGSGHETAQDFFKESLSPAESGCCKPPTYCGFEYQNATFWTEPKSGPEVPDSDCKTWSNNQTVLCYDCKSCKAGVLANIKNDWRELAIINTAILVFIIIIYSIGCCALRSNRSDRSIRQKNYV
ncbi:hypothetical protein F0562_025117 [Nyssa sinensis]|uniref:Tetraspanin n=1 Tax=Nyssa sinensis TaxID=561372 RepID=A0A5J5BH94_9ASTE|nr:hypothetical protein F0562_025117 [Nyssa sinensis]